MRRGPPKGMKVETGRQEFPPLPSRFRFSPQPPRWHSGRDGASKGVPGRPWDRSRSRNTDRNHPPSAETSAWNKGHSRIVPIQGSQHLPLLRRGQGKSEEGRLFLYHHREKPNRRRKVPLLFRKRLFFPRPMNPRGSKTLKDGHKFSPKVLEPPSSLSKRKGPPRGGGHEARTLPLSTPAPFSVFSGILPFPFLPLGLFLSQAAPWRRNGESQISRKLFPPARGRQEVCPIKGKRIPPERRIEPPKRKEKRRVWLFFPRIYLFTRYRLVRFSRKSSPSRSSF